jgi:hypothetical protein
MESVAQKKTKEPPTPEQVEATLQRERMEYI